MKSSQRSPFSKWFFTLFIGLSVLAIAPGSSAQNGEQEKLKAWAQSYLRHFKLDAKATPQDIDQLAGLRLKLIAPALQPQERQAAYTEAVALLNRLAGRTPAVLDSYMPVSLFTRTAHGLLTSGASQPNVQASSPGTTPPGQLGHVEKRGRGPIPMILIADAASDWTIYQTFMERHASRYTMYAVTLPGYGGTPPPPTPAIFDPAATPWFDHIEQALLKLIEKNRLNRPIVVGTQAGVYSAARLALHHPEKLRAAIFINGAVYAGLRDPAKPDQPLSLAERQRLLAPIPGYNGMLHGLLPEVRFTTREVAEQALKGRTVPLLLTPLRTLALAAARDQELVIKGLLGAAPETYRYLNELLFTDLTTDFKRLKIPALALVSVFDDRSALPGFTNIDQWTGLKLRSPEIPLTPVLFENARTYLTEDAPAELDQAITEFLAGKPVNVRRERGDFAARRSPLARATQIVGGVNVALDYSRPRVNKRELWGKVVPYNQVWRSGANEASRISFSQDVLIEGQRLKAGSYSFFTIPAPDEWIVIFNRIPLQFGAFNYNAEFDALRVKVKPQAAEHQEWLSFDFELQSSNGAQLRLRWEKLLIPVKVEEAPAR